MTMADPVSIFEDEKRASELMARIANAKAALARALAEGEKAEAAWLASVIAGAYVALSDCLRRPGEGARLQ